MQAIRVVHNHVKNNFYSSRCEVFLITLERNGFLEVSLIALEVWFLFLGVLQAPAGFSVPNLRLYF